jgi:hypothetical protein
LLGNGLTGSSSFGSSLCGFEMSWYFQIASTTAFSRRSWNHDSQSAGLSSMMVTRVTPASLYDIVIFAINHQTDLCTEQQFWSASDTTWWLSTRKGL